MYCEHFDVFSEHMNEFDEKNRKQQQWMFIPIVTAFFIWMEWFVNSRLVE